MVEIVSPTQALNTAVKLLGSQAELARLAKVSPTAVMKWLRSEEGLPARFVLVVEAATGVPRHELRPDIYPPDLGPSPRWHGVDGGALHVSFNREQILQAEIQERAA